MNQTDPLATLRDIHLPEAISWWPLAPGWWLAIILICAVIGVMSARLYRNHQRRLYRRQALLELQRIEGLADPRQLVELLDTLRRTAISAYPKQSFANLGPGDFLNFLKNTCAEPIFQTIPSNLEALLYSDQSATQQVLEDFFNSARVWIQKHPEQLSLEHPSC
jgi:hypothetical protein